MALAFVRRASSHHLSYHFIRDLTPHPTQPNLRSRLHLQVYFSATYGTYIYRPTPSELLSSPLFSSPLLSSTSFHLHLRHIKLPFPRSSTSTSRDDHVLQIKLKSGDHGRALVLVVASSLHTRYCTSHLMPCNFHHPTPTPTRKSK